MDEAPKLDNQDSANSGGAPASSRSIGTQYLVAAILVFAVFLALAWLDRQIAGQLRSDLEWTEHTREVEVRLESMATLVADMESDQRGYLIKGAPSYLQRFTAASAAIDGVVREVAQLTADNEVQRANLLRLTDLIARKRAQLQKTIDVRETLGAAAALAVVGTDAGTQLLDDVRAALLDMEREEDRLHAQRKSAERAILQRNALVRAIFTALVGLLLATAYFLIRREMVKRTRSERRLAEANAQLGSKVRERTRNLERSQARIAGIINSATDAIISIDETETIVLTNPAAREMFRCSDADMLGAPLTRFIPERYRAEHHRHVRAFGASGVATRRMAALRVVTGLRADGEEFPLDASISQLKSGDSTLFTVILRDITQAQKVKTALEQSHAELRELSAAVETVQEQERKRIARELHDELGQQLTVLKMDAHFIKSQLTAEQPDVTRAAERLERMIGQTVQSMRRISADLRPTILDDLGLVAALDELAARVSEGSGVNCRLVADDDISVDERLATPLYRIAQESLNNIVKHAAATEATVSLSQDETNRLVLRVRDNGKGMTADDRRKRKSFGLIGMRERVHTVGGDLNIVSRPMAGTLIEVSVPGRSADPGQPRAAAQP